MEKRLVKLFDDAYAFCEDEKYVEALKCYEEILQLEPDNINALIDKGVTLQNIGQLKMSIKSYDEALLLDPTNIDALVNKGSALHTLYEYEKAIDCYDKALEIDKKCAMAFAYKGLSLAEQGDVKDALEHFKKALSIDNDYDFAKISKEIAQRLLESIEKERTKKSKIQ